MSESIVKPMDQQAKAADAEASKPEAETAKPAAEAPKSEESGSGTQSSISALTGKAREASATGDGPKIDPKLVQRLRKESGAGKAPRLDLGSCTPVHICSADVH